MIKATWLTDSHVQTTWAAERDGVRRAAAYASANSDAILHTGDVGENSASNCAAAMALLRAATVPLFWCNGNHSEKESVVGSPSTSDFEAAACWDMSAPFYHTSTITGDGGEVARVLMLDSQFYDDSPLGDKDSLNHSPGDRIGYHPSAPPGSYYRQIGAAQLAWVASTLSADTTSDYIIVMLHYPPDATTYTDYILLADALQVDGRFAVLLSGHEHPNTRAYELLSSDELASYTVYKCPAINGSYSFTDLRISWDGSAPSVVLAEIQNYTQPSTAWDVSPPFSVATDIIRLLQYMG